MKINRYELKVTDTQNIDIGGAMPTILSVGEQEGKLFIWVQLEEDYPGSFNIDIDVIGTGNPYKTKGKYAGAVIMSNGKVWHVFAKINYVRMY